jgi:hypothetical protein
VPVSSAAVSAARKGIADRAKRARKIPEWRMDLRVRGHKRIGMLHRKCLEGALRAGNRARVAAEYYMEAYRRQREKT